MQYSKGIPINKLICQQKCYISVGSSRKQSHKIKLPVFAKYSK